MGEEKSHVSMEQHLCKATGKPFDTNAILFDKRLKNSMERNTITSWGFSPEVQEKLDEGYVVLVSVDIEKSIVIDNVITPENAYRTGAIAYVKVDAIKKIVPDMHIKDMAFVDDGFVEYLQSLPTE